MNPTHAGQFVTDGKRIGITTDAPRTRTPQVAVQFAGAAYPVLMLTSDVTVISVTIAN